jgi:hypothetical protein
LESRSFQQFNDAVLEHARHVPNTSANTTNRNQVVNRIHRSVFLLVHHVVALACVHNPIHKHVQPLVDSGGKVSDAVSHEVHPVARSAHSTNSSKTLLLKLMLSNDNSLALDLATRAAVVVTPK